MQIHSNHQPLKSVFSKSIVSCPPCIQKFLRLQPYIKILKPEFDENGLIHQIYFLILNLPINSERLDQFKEETRKDSILQTLIKYTIEGWLQKL